MTQWILSGDIIQLQEGMLIRPTTSKEVYEFFVEGGFASTPSIACSQAIRELSFSEFPVDMVIVLAVEDRSNNPTLRLEAHTQDGRCFPVSLGAVSCGHVVHERQWYPTLEDRSKSLLSLLDSVECDRTLMRPRTLGGYLKLKSVARNSDLVIDNLNFDELRNLHSSEDGNGFPVGIQATLYPYQTQGWKWLRYLIREELGGILGDEMGLGKTLQVISVLRDSGTDTMDSTPALVVAPSTLLENWIREINKFSTDLSSTKHYGPNRTGRPADLQCFDIVVVSYETVVRDLSLLKMITWNVVVLDEAQFIRNPSALRTKSVKELRRNVGLAVTGTPIENRLRDLWSIFDFVLPGYLGPCTTFESEYQDEACHAARLEPVVSPFLLRRKIVDVARDLPERIDISETIDLAHEEASEYDFIRQQISRQYGSRASLVSLSVLRQYCSHPSILTAVHSVLVAEFSKFKRLQCITEEIFLQGDKAILFTSYQKMADKIALMVDNEFGVMSAILDGRSAAEERQLIIDKFTELRGPAMLILNPRAGGTGLNITAATHVIHYNLEWNPALEDQATGRAYRRGQLRPVTVRRLICAGTVEEVIDERLRRKRRVAEAAIVGVEGTHQDREDIVLALERTPVTSWRSHK